MPFTIDDALEHELVAVENRNDVLGIYEIKIGKLDTLVRIELGNAPGAKVTKFSVSHVIKTPAQLGPYRPGRTFNDNPPSALRQAITGLTQYYEQAVKKGHEPEESWLIEN